VIKIDRQLEEDNLRPVLVVFPGGGFFAGDGTDSVYGPEYLVNEDLVVVTMNYRVGPLGEHCVKVGIL